MNNIDKIVINVVLSTRRHNTSKISLYKNEKSRMHARDIYQANHTKCLTLPLKY